MKIEVAVHDVYKLYPARIRVFSTIVRYGFSDFRRFRISESGLQGLPVHRRCPLSFPSHRVERPLRTLTIARATTRATCLHEDTGVQAGSYLGPRDPSTCGGGGHALGRSPSQLIPPPPTAITVPPWLATRMVPSLPSLWKYIPSRHHRFFRHRGPGRHRRIRWCNHRRRHRHQFRRSPWVSDDSEGISNAFAILRSGSIFRY